MASAFKEAKILTDLMRRTSSVMIYSPSDGHDTIILVHMTSINAACLIEHPPGGHYAGFTYRSDGGNPVRFMRSVQSTRKAFKHIWEFYTLQQADPTTRISSEKELCAIRESDLLMSLNKFVLRSA